MRVDTPPPGHWITERPGGGRGCDPRTEMRCDDGQCIQLRRKCDNVFDCFDNSDERGCGKSFDEPYLAYLDPRRPVRSRLHARWKSPRWYNVRCIIRALEVHSRRIFQWETHIISPKCRSAESLNDRKSSLRTHFIQIVEHPKFYLKFIKNI